MARCENAMRPGWCEQDLCVFIMCVRPSQIYRNMDPCLYIEHLTLEDACDSQPVQEEVKQPTRLVGLLHLTPDQLREIADRQSAIYKDATRGRYGVRKTDNGTTGY
jgi:hypothetical protein